MLLGGYSSCQGCGCQPALTCFDGVTPASDYDAFNDTGFLAGGISIGSSPQTLSSVTIYNDGSTAGTVTCILWPNDTTNSSLPFGPRPKPRQDNPPYNFPPECVFLTPPGSFSGSTWTFTNSGVTLNANTIYWIVMAGRNQTGANRGSGGWRWEDWIGAVNVSDTCYQLSSITQNSATLWSDNLAGNRYLFDWS